MGKDREEDKAKSKDDAQGSFPTRSLEDLSEELGTTVGPYKLLSVLGEGGFGIVYRAEHRRPVRRHVALKVLKPGMDSKQVMGRFEAERQALALLDHPNIARVFDGGTTENGRPYFVMELVKGVPITEHCDRKKLNSEQRLQLFLQVCKAVQHAHQKGVIHRDIKPSNILVARRGDRAEPKIIDFGVAKAISQPLTERTLFTEQGQLVGTPEYMSPEQAELTSQDVDTRTDIYSLGVLLYELLTGLLPFDSQTLREGGIDHIRHMICEEDPKTPSTRLSTVSGEDLTKLAQSRKTDVRLLKSELRGDLDWITIKAIEKDPDRRYETAHTLAEDIQRHLNHEPVRAAPPGVIYRVRKFARKHRAALMSALGVLVVLILGLALIRAELKRRGERKEIAAQKQTIEKEKRMLEVEGQLSDAKQLYAEGEYEQALSTVEKVLESETIEPKARLLYAKLLFELDRSTDAVAELEGLLDKSPEIAGAAHNLLARVYMGRDHAKAIEHQKKCEELLPESPDAYSLRAMTAGTVGEGIEWLEKALDLDPGHYPSHRALALTYYGMRDFRSMEQEANVMVAIKKNDPQGYSLVAIALRESDSPADAVRYHDKAIGLSPANPKLYDQRRRTHMRTGDYEKALSDAEKCVQLQPDEKIHHFHVFCALVGLGRYDEAKATYSRIFQSDPAAKAYFRRESEKYVFDTLNSGRQLNLPDSSSQDVAFWPMHEAADYYGQLDAKGERAVIGGFAATWSPDGNELVYSRGIPGSNGIEILDVNSGKTRLLTVPGKDPVWSPDGRYIAFVRERQYQSLEKIIAEERDSYDVSQEEVWITTPEGGDMKFLAKGGWPSWSRDSKRLYFRAPGLTLHSISIEDANAQPQSIVYCPNYYPTVDPCETYVAYSAKYSDRCELRIVELASGSVVANWKAPTPENLIVQWSPDGRELSVGGFGTSNFGLWIYNLDTQTALKVLNGPVTFGAWSPDGSRMAFNVREPFFEIWVANLEPNISTAEALGPGQTIDEHYEYVMEQYLHAIEVDALDSQSSPYLAKLVQNVEPRGMEYYEAGEHQKAVLMLSRLDRLRRALGNESRPRDAAFIVMALHQLDRRQEADAALSRLRELFREHTYIEEGYLYKAERLLAGDDQKILSVWESIDSGDLEKAAQLAADLKSSAYYEDAENKARVQSIVSAIARAYYQRAKTAKHRGDKYVDAVADYKAVVRLDPDHVRAYCDLAWLQAACPAAEVRDGNKALENATRACVLTNWQDHRYVAALAAVSAEIGDFAAAARHQTKAIDLLPNDEVPKWRASYESRLRLFQSGKRYDKGNLWSFSTGRMVGWWKFDESEGEIAEDSSGNGLHGALIGDACTASDPIRGNVLSLDGDGDYVEIPKIADSVELTYALWVKQHVIGVGFVALIDDQVWTFGSVHFELLDGRPKVGIHGAIEPGGDLVGPDSVPTKEWHQLALVKSATELVLYVDGEPVALRELTKSDPVSLGGAYIGAYRLKPRYFSGQLDDVRIYSYALSEEEIRDLYEETAQKPDVAEPVSKSHRESP